MTEAKQNLENLEPASWEGQLPLFTAQPNTHFYFKPLRAKLFGSPQPRIFPLKTFVYQNRIFTLWPTAGNLLNLLERTGHVAPVFPQLQYNYGCVGFAYPDGQRVSVGFPWESPCLLVLGSQDSHFGELAEQAWLRCQQKAEYVLVMEESALSPVYADDRSKFALRLNSYQKHLRDLKHLFPYPGVTLLREIFGLGNDFEIPETLLPQG